MRNNEHTFQAFSVTISTYANKLMSTNSIQVVIIWKTLVYTRTRSVLKRVTIGYEIMPFLTRLIIVAKNPYFVSFSKDDLTWNSIWD